MWSFELWPYSEHFLDSVDKDQHTRFDLIARAPTENTDKPSASHHWKFKINDQIDARLFLAKPVPAHDVLSKRYGHGHLLTHARMHLRTAILTFVARSGFPIVVVSGLQKCNSCRFGRSLAQNPIITSPCLHRSFQPLPNRKKLPHSYRLDVSPGILPARACLSTRHMSDPNVPLDMETPFPGDVVQRPWNWTIGTAGWAITTATASACHVWTRPRRVKSAWICAAKYSNKKAPTTSC